MNQIRFNSIVNVARLRSGLAAALVSAVLACSGDNTEPIAPGFLGGTSSNHEIGVVVNSLSKSLTLFQIGSPATPKQIPLGTSSTVTPVRFAGRARLAAVPLGSASSIALVDLETSVI